LYYEMTQYIKSKLILYH